MNKQNVLISIILPIYNVDKYLINCLESIINQTVNNFELILVDDGSDDNCPKICDNYANKYSNIIVIHKENGGLVSARKAGIRVARGKYVCCVDSDDWIENNYIEKLTSVINNNDDVDIVCFNYNEIKNNKIMSKKMFDDRILRLEDIKKDIYPILLQSENAEHISPSLCNKMFKRELYKKIQLSIDNDLKIGEDSACCIPCIYNASSIVLISDCLYNYRRNVFSMTKSIKGFSWDGPELIRNNICNNININEYDFENQMYRKIVHELFHVVISQFKRKEDFNKITKEIENNLQYPLYSEAINKAKFKNNIYAVLMHLSLKFRLFVLLSIWSKIKEKL